MKIILWNKKRTKREKNEKLCKIKKTGESDHTPFIDRTQIL